MTKIVETEGLTKVYPPSIRAVDGISFSVEEGRKFETLAAIGSTFGLPLLFASSAASSDFDVGMAERHRWRQSNLKGSGHHQIPHNTGALGSDVMTSVIYDFVFLAGFATVCTALGILVPNHGLRME